MNKTLPILFTLLVLLVTVSCRQPGQKSQKTQPTVKIPVKTATVVTGDMQDTLRIYGLVRLRTDVLLASQFDGRLTDFSLLTGDRVTKGQQVGIIVPPLREALLRVLDQVPASRRKALSEEIKEIPLLSPCNGVVLKVFRHSGDVVQKGEPVVRIADLKHLDVYADLPVQYIPLVRKMKTLHVRFINYPHDPLTLPVSAFAGKVDETRQTLALRLSLPNPQEQFRPGMRTELRFPGVLHKHTLIIPRSAVLEQEGIFSVFVVKNGKARKRKVTVGIRQNNRFEILSGLKAGEKVVTDKANSLTDGMEVTVR
ncbi:MAG TPA: efflux RND transporter periplasmic adaptor subunit [Bacteroidetes bacterium]|nr:efflux RND transporter periplasmic adaptor subunit [Bacteroidota bacterium]